MLLLQKLGKYCILGITVALLLLSACSEDISFDGDDPKLEVRPPQDKSNSADTTIVID
jgi:hypothetical protein